MGDAHHCSGPPDSEMTYTVSSGTLNSSIPCRTIVTQLVQFTGVHIRSAVFTARRYA